MKSNKVSKVWDVLKKSIFADVLGGAKVDEDNMTSEDLSNIIAQLSKEKNKLQAKEKQEKENVKKLEASQQRQEEKAKENERIVEITSMELPLDWENVFDCDARTEGVHAESISDALIMSLTNLGCVDIEYMSSITGEDYKTVICALKGSIYQNPETWNECFYKGWETAEEYLSGNIIKKWKAATEANKKYKGYFEDNVNALDKLIPESISENEIYITLGSPWVPVSVIDDFIAHILNLKKGFCGTTHDELTGTWEIPNKSWYWHNVASTNTYGTPRLEALYIMEKTLNMKAVSITDEIVCHTNASGKKRVINQTETVLALEKQQKMIKEFQRWVWQDQARKNMLVEIFENQFGGIRRRIFDGSFLNFPTLDPSIKLYDYQKNAVARILFSKNTLLAHDVGSGKTFIMIAAGMELKRMGLSKKNLYVVPNNIVGQWHDIFKKLYPNANLLCIEPKNFKPQKRESVIEKMRDNDYDAIIMAYSCFEQIPVSREFYKEELTELKDKIKQIEKDAKKSTSKLRKKREAIEKKLSELVVALDTEESIYFDDLGITRLFIDEAHNFKNVPIETKADKVLGINATGSKKCQIMMDKVNIVQKQDGGVIMATGTPITNSITDAFIFQKYLQSGSLALLDLQSFDSWIGMFAERATEFEIDVDTSSYRLATRFSKFHNLPELTSMLSEIADFHQMDVCDSIPECDGRRDAVVDKTDDLKDFLELISHRADCVRNGIVRRTEDNMLKITTDGRKAALDIRLVSPAAKFTYQSKVARCAENVFGIYLKTGLQKSTQLVFCDTSTPKKEFNLYDELKNMLVAMGIPESEIAYVHDATTEAQRTKLFAKVVRGEVRVLMGSTFKLGLGVNVQNKLVALHHLDVPWRPADMTQREGRILRQGNENKKVDIYRYITEGSFDAYSWQLLETKQRFITELLSGSLTERSSGDIENTILDYAEVKALAIGNPLIKERVETANDLIRYLSLKRKSEENYIKLQKELAETPAKITRQLDLINKCERDIKVYEENYQEHDKDDRKIIRESLYEAVSNNVLMPSETSLTCYQGFGIILPSNMSADKPFVWLQNNGRYYVELGDTEVGALIRIDNFLGNLSTHLEKLKEGYEQLLVREESIKAELCKKEDYDKIIERIKRSLKKIDEELGVAS